MVVAYGRIIKPHVLDVLPMVNIHFSLLPRWRGAAPVERAILAGDQVTGVCVMALEEGLDTGPVYACEERTIGEEETLEEVRAALTETGTRMLVDLLATGLPEPQPQGASPRTRPSSSPRSTTSTGAGRRSSCTGSYASGPAWTTFRGRRLRVLRARGCRPQTLAPGELDPGTLRVGTGAGALELLEVQPEGKGPQAALAWRNGARLQPGERFV